MDVATAQARTGPVRVLGRLVRDRTLADATGSLPLVGDLSPAQIGDLVLVRGDLSRGALRVERIEVAQRGSLSGAAALVDGPERYLGNERGLARLAERFAFHTALRRWLSDHGFALVDAPALLPSAGTDVNIDPVEARFVDVGARPFRGYLHTSPELSLKRLLVAGFPQVAFVGSVFRSGEASVLHQLEFTMAEWYRAGGDYGDMMDDLRRILADLLHDRVVHDGRELPIPAEIPRVAVRDLFLEASGVDLARCADAPALRAALVRRGLPASGQAYDELFFRVFVERAEPLLARHPAVFLTDYPAPLAALARLKPDDPGFAERFELYVCGIELANGYTELTDAAEQRARMEQDNAQRAGRGQAVMPLPEAFLESLAVGMPPAGGVSLGVDRLFLLAAGASDLHDVVAFPFTRERFHPIA